MEKEYSWKYLQINRGRKVIFDSADVPFLKPLPNLSDLGDNVSVAEKFRINWPDVIFNRACVVDGAILIQDISSDTKLTQAAKKLNEVSNITLQVVDGQRLTRDMVGLIENSGILNTKPLIIFPGNGAASIKEFLDSADERFSKSCFYLPTQRTMVRNGEFQLDVDYSSLLQKIDSKTVLIIDDVVASGQTAQTIASEIKTRFPNIGVILAAWLFMMPTKPKNKKSPSGIVGVDQMLASIVLKGNLTSRPPINSLSCFLRSENKYEEMKTNFLKKYFTDQDAFKKLINDMQNKI